MMEMRATTTRLLASSSFQDDGSNSKNKPTRDKESSITNMERERREETKRRKQRQQEVVIGQTSAQIGAQDYRLDPQSTEQEYLQQASQVERQVFQFTQQGMEAIKSLQLHQANIAFQTVFQWKPNAYLWQAGIVQYYLNDIVTAAFTFTSCAQIYETKFQLPATEERIWWDACALKYYSNQYNHNDHNKDDDDGDIDDDISTSHHTKQLSSPPQQQHSNPTEINITTTATTTTIMEYIHNVLPPIPDMTLSQNDDDDDDNEEEKDFTAFIRQERRIVMVYARELFAAAVRQDHPAVITVKAKLESLAGIPTTTGCTHHTMDSHDPYNEKDDEHDNNNNIQPQQPDKKLRKLTSLFYLGLFHDAMGDMDQCRYCMKRALLLQKSSSYESNGRSKNLDDNNNLIQTLPLLHLTVRGLLDG